MGKKKGVKLSLFFLGMAYGTFPLLWGCLVQVGVNSPSLCAYLAGRGPGWEAPPFPTSTQG